MTEAEPPIVQPTVTRFFRKPPPSSPDAHRIWTECCLGDIMDLTSIYWALDSWARINCSIFMKDDRHYVYWTSPSGVSHECFADTFAHWILCACEEITTQPQATPQSLTPNVELQPTWTPPDEEVENDIIFEHVEKISDEADTIIQSFKDDNALSFDEILNVNLEAFLNDSIE